MSSAPESRRGWSLLNASSPLIEQASGEYLAVDIQRLQHGSVGRNKGILMRQTQFPGGEIMVSSRGKTNPLEGLRTSEPLEIFCVTFFMPLSFLRHSLLSYSLIFVLRSSVLEEASILKRKAIRHSNAVLVTPKSEPPSSVANKSKVKVANELEIKNSAI